MPPKKKLTAPVEPTPTKYAIAQQRKLKQRSEISGIGERAQNTALDQFLDSSPLHWKSLVNGCTDAELSSYMKHHNVKANSQLRGRCKRDDRLRDLFQWQEQRGLNLKAEEEAAKLMLEASEKRKVKPKAEAEPEPEQDDPDSDSDTESVSSVSSMSSMSSLSATDSDSSTKSKSKSKRSVSSRKSSSESEPPSPSSSESSEVSPMPITPPSRKKKSKLKPVKVIERVIVVDKKPTLKKLARKAAKIVIDSGESTSDDEDQDHIKAGAVNHKDQLKPSEQCLVLYGEIMSGHGGALIRKSLRNEKLKAELEAHVLGLHRTGNLTAQQLKEITQDWL